MISEHGLIFAVPPFLLGKYHGQKEGKNKELGEKIYMIFFCLCLLINLLMFLYSISILKIFKGHLIII